MKGICSKFLFAIIAISAISILITIPAFSQEDKPVDTAAPVAEAAAGTEIPIYGEVQSVNASTSTMNVLYYDEETYEEKSIDLVADAATKMQNANALADIKEGDWVDAAYSVKGGKNMISSVIVEKEETELPPETAPVAESEME